jgi:ribonuclease PH
MFNIKTKTFDIGDGRMVTIETGKLARQADGSVTVRMGNCVLLATVVANKEQSTKNKAQRTKNKERRTKNLFNHEQRKKWSSDALKTLKAGSSRGS